MRILRPGTPSPSLQQKTNRVGMVVGPQQHWLHINQHHFRAWTHLGLNPSPTKKRISNPSSSRNVSFSTPQRNPLGPLESNSSSHHDTPLPAPTPGQPRKNRDRLLRADHSKDPVVSVVAETTSKGGTKVTVNVTTPDREAARVKRTASYAALGKSPSGGGRRVMSRNAENISPHGGTRPVGGELVRTTSGRVVAGGGKSRVGSNASVKDGRVRKASGSTKERVVSSERQR